MGHELRKPEHERRVAITSTEMPRELPLSGCGRLPVKSLLRGLNRFCSGFGIDIVKMGRAVQGVPRLIRTATTYRRLHTGSQFPLSVSSLYLCPTDYRSEAGRAGGHYFHQDLWAARRIYRARPSRHVDVGSRLDGFVAHVLSFMPVTVVDVRPLKNSVEGLSFVHADATNMNAFPDRSIESLSSLHAAEHFGLGRYGDPVDPDAAFRLMHALARVLSPAGRLYFSVPIGVERLEFNAHRVFAPSTILQHFAELRLLSFSAVDDSGAFHCDTEPDLFAPAEYACGLFEFTR